MFNLPYGDYWMYLRKSRADVEAETRGEGETLSKHRKALLGLAKKNNINVTRVFEEIKSGESILGRPKMVEMLRLMEEGPPKGVLCMDIDRLGRGDKIDQGIIERSFKDSNTLIVTPSEIFDMNDESGEFNVEVRSFLARLELKQSTKRMQDGRVRSVKEGNYIGARPPYGYMTKKDKNGRYLVPHPDQAEAVKLIYKLYTHPDPKQRIGSSKIANKLNTLPYRTYSGKPWESSTVLFILKNAVYAGRIQWRKTKLIKARTADEEDTTFTRPKDEWIDVKGKHEPLISMETYLAAQEILKGKYHVPYQLVNGITNPLAGLVKCDMCGASMVYRPYTNQKAHIMCYVKSCPNKSSQFSYVEEKLLNGLNVWLENHEDQWKKDERGHDFNSDMIKLKKNMISKLNTELKALRVQSDNLHDLLERGIYSEDKFIERSQMISDRIKKKTESISKIKGELNLEKNNKIARIEIIPKVKRVLDLYPHIDDPTEKNNLLKSILQHSLYRKEKHQRKDEFTLYLFPKIPNDIITDKQ